MPDLDADTTKRLMSRLEACVVIPTYNNAATLAAVVDGAGLYAADIIVVDDGSTDATAAILAERAGKLTAVTHPRNMGKGAALRSGLTKAKEMGFRNAVTIDADGQHFPSDLPRLAAAAERHPGEIIVGSRNLNHGNMPGKSKFANRFSNFWFTVQTGRRLSDTQTGYRLYPLQRLRGVARLTARYEAELELLVLAAWHGVGLRETPVNVHYPPAGERISHFRPAADFARISLLNTLLCFGAIVYGWPRMTINRLLKKR